MKNLRTTFKNLKIGQKILVCSVGIILIMALLMGVCGYAISRQMLLSRTEEQSVKLMEQLSRNYNYAIKNMENLVTSQTHNNKFSNLLKKNPSTLGVKARYDRKKEIEEYGYNLINFNKYITKVIVGDNYGNIYYSDNERNGMDAELMEKCLAYDEAYERWGVTIWKPCDENEVFATKLLFDYGNMKPLGAISIGVTSSYFREMYENLVTEGTGIAVLNENQEILLTSSEESRNLAEIILTNYPEDTKENREIYYRNEKYLYTTWKEPDGRIQVMNLLSESYITGEIFRKLMIPLLFLAVAAIVLSAVLAFSISGQISANIKLLLENIRQISRGDFERRIIPESRDEIGMLAEEFNDMAVQIQNLLKTITDEKMQKKNSEIKALQFEYDALQAKINPHFLYNTLESINSLAKINGQEKIADSVYMLGNYLREAISDKRKFVTLEEELENSRQYVEIQKLSHGDKIQVDFQVDEALRDAMVPKLILQPLVENAIIHGIEPKIGQGCIHIVSFCDKKDMVLQVSDNGVGVAGERISEVMSGKGPDDKRHTKVGIRAVHKRIQILYGPSYGIEVESKENEGTSVSVRLPINFEDEV